MNQTEKKQARIELENLKEKRLERSFVIRADVYTDRRPGDCTNGGESAKHNTLYLFTERMSANAARLYAEDEGIPLDQCVQVEKRFLFGRYYYSAIPLDEERRKKWYMFGGNFLYTSDSRYKEVTSCDYPIPVHDRVEEYQK